jgi:hypothetical protein
MFTKTKETWSGKRFGDEEAIQENATQQMLRYFWHDRTIEQLFMCLRSLP